MEEEQWGGEKEGEKEVKEKKEEWKSRATPARSYGGRDGRGRGRFMAFALAAGGGREGFSSIYRKEEGKRLAVEGERR